jgi:ABC-type transport system involved in multi-copper enzyme maturation permease subunit
MVRVVVLGAIGLLVVSGIITFVQAGKDARTHETQSNPFVEREVRRCVRGDYGPHPGLSESELRAECEAMVGADPRFQYSSIRDVLLGSSPPFLLLAVLLGASFIGAEWHFGTITTALTWEPRRMRILAVKAVVVTVFAAIFFIILQAILAAVLYPAAAVYGTTTGLDAAWMRDVAGIVVRGALLAAISALIGFSFASIGRNTTAAMGTIFVYFVAIEPIVRALRPGWVKWLFIDNASIFISEQSTSFPPLDRSVWGAGLLLAIYSGIALIAGLMWFKRRDVT